MNVYWIFYIALKRKWEKFLKHHYLQKNLNISIYKILQKMFLIIKGKYNYLKRGEAAGFICILDPVTAYKINCIVTKYS